MEKKLLVWVVVASLLMLGSVGQATTVIMDGTLHNGSLTASAAGQWVDGAAYTPTGWYEGLSYGCYQAGGGTWTIIASSYGSAINNTGEVVQTGEAFTVTADLGNSTAMNMTVVNVYATQNADGSGAQALLATVSRLNEPGQGYTLYHTVGTQGTAAGASLNGYYVQVVLVGGGSYFDNIGVTAEIPEPATMVLLGIGGLFLRKRK